MKSAADLYVYPNTVNVVLLNGDEVREWLEHAAGQFNQIVPGKSGEQPSSMKNSLPTCSTSSMALRIRLT